MKILRSLLDLILPPRCISCGKIVSEENGLCPECFSRITFISKPYCRRCGLPFADSVPADKNMLCPECLKAKKSLIGMSRSAVKYDEHSKNTILALKFMDKTENAAIFAKWLKIAGKDIFESGADLLVPVPLHYRRLVARRYNQSALLAAELSKLTGLEISCSSLVKHKPTKPQASVSGEERIKNVKGVFSVKNPDAVRGRHVVLIDDVYTTGSTVRECAAALHEAGAAEIDALTIARVYR